MTLADELRNVMRAVNELSFSLEKGEKVHAVPLNEGHPLVELPRPRSRVRAEEVVQVFGVGSISIGITGGSQSSGWEWKEKEGVSGGGWQDLSGGRTHTSDGKAYCTRDIVEVVTGTVVFAWPVALTGGGTEWRFEPPLPTPTTEYMVLAVDANGKWHVDWVRAH